MKKIKIIVLPILAAFVLLLNSCIGLSMDIQLNRDGSSRLTMIYNISRVLYNMGELDGNVQMPSIPLSRQDLQRTLDRIPGSRLASYSNRETTRDIIINTVIEFPNTQTLVSFLNSNVSNISINHNGLSGNFDMIIHNESSSAHSENLKELARQSFDGYNFSISFSAPANSTMTITDGAGNAINTPSSAQAALSGRRVSLQMNMFDSIFTDNGLGVKFNWQQ